MDRLARMMISPCHRILYSSMKPNDCQNMDIQTPSPSLDRVAARNPSRQRQQIHRKHTPKSPRSCTRVYERTELDNMLQISVLLIGLAIVHQARRLPRLLQAPGFGSENQIMVLWSIPRHTHVWTSPASRNASCTKAHRNERYPALRRRSSTR